MKRKSELRCIPLNLQLSKCPIKINLFGVQKLQPFFPPIECLFKTENLERSSEYGFKLPETITSIQDSVILTSLGNKIEVHPKITMLLNPYKWMKGDVCSIDLPCSSEKSKIIQTKLQNHNNAAYVGSIFSLVFSLSECQHFPNVYGIYSGISDKFILDISDDYEELSEKPWFSKNIGNTFELKLNEIKENFIKYTRSARLPLSLGEELQLDDVEELEGIESSDVISGEFTKIFEETEDNQSHTSSSESTIDVFELQSVSEYSNYENDDEFIKWKE
jgi:hypothetical protein